MPLETANYVSQLVDTNPADTDSEGQGSDHLRLIKLCLLQTFPNFTAAALTSTQSQIETAVTQAGTAVQPAANGSVPTGSIHSFPADPGSTLAARGGTATGSEQFILMDGSSYASSLFPTLAASAFVTVSGSNFSVPNLMDTGRFLRAYVSGTTTPGTSQANQNASHSHTLTDPGHTHTVTDPGHEHGITDPGHHHTYNEITSITGAGSTGTFGSESANTGTSTTGITVNSATTGITNQSATTGITMATEGGTEARPEAFVVFMCMKT